MKLCYNRTFRKGLVAILICIAMSALILTLFVISTVQYRQAVSKMEPCVATVTDLDNRHHVRGPSEQIIFVSYEVDGVVYERELETDTGVSFSAGVGAHYSVGDKIDIFYDPQNPEVIAVPRSVGVGVFYTSIAAVLLLLVLWALFRILKHRRDFLVTEEEYRKEGEEIKKAKAMRRAAKRARHPVLRKVMKIIGIVLLSLLTLFVLFLLFVQLLILLRG